MSFEKMNRVGKLTNLCLQELQDYIKPGIQTRDIETYVVAFQKRHGLKNSQYGYHGFPGHCCTSVNNEICHGIPSDRILNDGDIVKVDVTFNLDGWHGDSCRTYEIGEVSKETQKLVDCAKSALWIGIAKAYSGNMVSDIGIAIDNYVKSQGFSVVNDYFGHGIGLKMHMSPMIPHCPHRSIPDQRIVPGMMFTIEPMINMGSGDSFVSKDGWTVLSKDNSLSAQFEMTLGITENDHVIFTR